MKQIRKTVVVEKKKQQHNDTFYNSAGILEQSIGARNRVGIALSYRPGMRLHRLAESIPGLHKSL
jgi:hypothetical protein